MRLSSIARSTSSRRRTAPWRASPADRSCPTGESSLLARSRACSNCPALMIGSSLSHALLFLFATSDSVTNRSMVIEQPSAMTRTIGYMNVPPFSKKRTTVYQASMSYPSILASEATAVRGGVILLLGRLLLGRRCRASSEIEVVQLPPEHVPIDGHRPVVHRARDADAVADLGALPRHDHERFRRVLIAENRDAGHVPHLRLLRRVVGKRRRGARDE